MKKLIILLTIAALVCVTFSAMAAGDGIAFDTSVTAINEGETLQTVLTREGDAAGGEVTYTSSNPKMATVDANGLVTAVLKGRVVITATVKADKKSYKAQLKLEIVRPVTALTVNTSKLEVYAPTDEKVASLLRTRENAEENELPVLLLPVKKKIAISAAVEPKDANNRNVTMTSSDESVFTAAKGAVTGVAPGEAILTIASESNPDIASRYRVLVVQPVTKVTVEASVPSVAVGQQATVTAKVEPENATVKNITWSSGDERILTVDANGTVTALKRGNGRIIASASDGSNIRANFNLKVVQNPESITLSADELTIDVGRNAPCKATILPKDTDNKKLIWTSSDESVATVDKTGRIAGKAIGDCVITCTSEALDSVTASVKVHIQQPVKKITFMEKSAYGYPNEGTQLAWIVEPADATNPTVVFTSSNEKVATVDESGLITGLGYGKAKITATSTDGSRRSASITVQIGKHVTGVEMIRKHAYIDPGEKATAGANIKPRDALNQNMIWESSDTSIVTAVGTKKKHQTELTAINYGDAVITGTTEDGGFQTTLQVTVGDFDHGISFQGRVSWDENAYFWLPIRNDTNFVITEITASVTVFNGGEPDNPPAPVNTQTGKNTVNLVWRGRLSPGATTGKSGWKMTNFKLVDMDTVDMNGKVTLCSYQIDGDWVKNIQPKHRTTKKYGNR